MEATQNTIGFIDINNIYLLPFIAFCFDERNAVPPITTIAPIAIAIFLAVIIEPFSLSVSFSVLSETVLTISS